MEGICSYCCNFDDPTEAIPDRHAFKDPFWYSPEETLIFVDGLQVDSNWNNYRALIIRDVDLQEAYSQLRRLLRLPNVHHIGINVDNVTVPEEGPSMTDYLENAKAYHIAQEISTCAVTGDPSYSVEEMQRDIPYYSVSVTLMDVPSLQYVSYTSRYLPESIVYQLNLIPLRFLKISCKELPQKVAITNSSLEVLEFADNSHAHATELTVQSPNLRSLAADASRVVLPADLDSLECVFLSFVPSLVSAVRCNLKVVKLWSCTKDALLLFRPSEELFVARMDNVALHPESSLRVLQVEESRNITLVTSSQSPLDVLVLNKVTFASSQSEIHAKRVWWEFLNPSTLSGIDLPDATHLGTFCSNHSCNQVVERIRSRIRNNDLFTVTGSGYLIDRDATKRAWLKKIGYTSRLLTENSFFG